MVDRAAPKQRQRQRVRRHSNPRSVWGNRGSGGSGGLAWGWGGSVTQRKWGSLHSLSLSLALSSFLSLSLSLFYSSFLLPWLLLQKPAVHVFWGGGRPVRQPCYLLSKRVIFLQSFSSSHQRRGRPRREEKEEAEP